MKIELNEQEIQLIINALDQLVRATGVKNTIPVAMMQIKIQDAINAGQKHDTNPEKGSEE